MQSLIYVPSPYSLTNISFEELPHLAQHYLTDVLSISAPHAMTPGQIETEMSRLCAQLCRALEGNTMALVQARRQADLACLDAEPRSPVDLDADNAQRVLEVLGILLPERERLMDDFVGRFDALVWLDLSQPREEPLSIEQQKKYRDEHPLFQATLQSARDVLVALDCEVALLDEMRRGPSSVSPMKQVFWQGDQHSMPSPRANGNFSGIGARRMSHTFRRNSEASVANWRRKGESHPAPPSDSDASSDAGASHCA
ncbi:hypothetical protein PsYK624_061090 [Phanerochaete sordida]|uniref:Uncharacterized protein n=1 Tax=Phanerochaete sordida TaxID=48140 RepID=A0A9P3G8Q9_9APHY|nr:hypothetical protein PsYK624_061090 [Phanerochaete sordida]